MFVVVLSTSVNAHFFVKTFDKLANILYCNDGFYLLDNICLIVKRIFVLLTRVKD